MKPISIKIGQVINTAHGTGVYIGYEKIDYRHRVYTLYGDLPDFVSPNRILVELDEGHTWLPHQNEYAMTLNDYLTHN